MNADRINRQVVSYDVDISFESYYRGELQVIALICVDDSGGTMFNHRRQSRDRIIRADMLHESGNHRLWMNSYSAKQFAPEGLEGITISDDFLEQSGVGDYCFVEGISLAAYEEKIETLILYKWNRLYPSDTFFDIPLVDHGWELTESTELSGYSHEKITKEVYKR